MLQNLSRRRAPQLTSSAAIAGSIPSALSACSVTKHLKPSFDYVIIGAGSAGSVLAARLTENSNTRVSLLEAGPVSNDPLIDDPKNWFRLTFSEYVWQDKGAAQTHAQDKNLLIPHGKLVGGSSAINAMIHHRPTPSDLNDWNLPNWGWAELAPMFARSETWRDGPAPTRGKAGPIQVMKLPDGPPLADATFAAAENLGLGVSPDLNGEVQLGAGDNQLAFDGQKRQHTGYAYLGPALDRPNLTVETGAHATDLLFSGERCVGVAYDVGGIIRESEAGKVILCAGALRSPAI